MSIFEKVLASKPRRPHMGAIMRHLRSPIAAVFAGLAISGCLPTFEGSHTVDTPPSAASFREIPTPFTHVWREPSHPFTGAAVIDTDGDGRLEVFVGGGRGQADALLAYEDGALKDRIAGTGLSAAGPATHGAASIDMDGDGRTDLLVTREDGLTLYRNGGGTFSAHRIALNLQTDAVPLSVSVSDIDGDGDADLYVSGFVSFNAFKSATFNDPDHAKQNIVLRNDGNMIFTDVTANSGAVGLQNTFHAVFANLDGDTDQDLILSQNTGEIEILENMGQGRFKNVPTRSGYGFWMGLAVGDVDQDGDVDVFASNIGTSIPDFLTSGDLKDDQRQHTDWGLLVNQGSMKFADAADTYNLLDYGFAWGAQFEDLNLDGLTDLLVAQNYIKWPLHKWAPLPGKALLQAKSKAGRGFYQVPGMGLDNAHFGQSPVIVDLDGDGRADVLWLNMDGPLRAFLNTTEGSYLSVRLPDTVAALGATVQVVTSSGQTYARQVIASTGLMTDPTPDLHFGLGGASAVQRLDIQTMNGQRRTIEAPPVNRQIRIDLP